MTLWEQYSAWQKDQLAPSTLKWDYPKIARRIAKIPKDLKRTPDIVDWMREHYAPETVRRTVAQLSACYAWAVGTGKTGHNPWANLPKIRPTHGNNRYKAFSPQDREKIIAAFRRDYPELSPWVEFLFYTGARPSEAAGLLWGNIAPDCSRIRIDAAYNVASQTQQSTKTHTAREFSCGPQLQQLLQSLRPPHPSPKDRVFMGERGRGPFNYQWFQTRRWKPIVSDLAENGDISCYLSQYHCRHTKATQLLRSGYDIKDSAALLGHHPHVFLSAYAQEAENLKIPD